MLTKQSYEIVNDLVDSVVCLFVVPFPKVVFCLS